MNRPKPIELSAADVARFWSKVNRAGLDECWEWTEYRNKDGYGQFYDCNCIPYRANRVAYAVTNGDTELDVLHDCDHPWCCNPAHLFAGTQDDNNRQCRDRGRHVTCCGEECGNAEITEDDVRAIRVDGRAQREIAEDYGISQTQVSRICRGVDWKHVSNGSVDSNEKESCNDQSERCG